MAVDNTLGPLFFGVIIAAILFGFTCVQTWRCFTDHPSDPWYLKLFVATVIVFDAGHQVLITHQIYTYIITDFGAFSVAQKVVWSYGVQVFFNAFTTLLVQSFLAVRIYKLNNKNWAITGIVTIFIIAEFATSILLTVKAFPPITYLEFATLGTLLMTINALAAVGGIIIAASLYYPLKSAFQGPNTRISKWIVVTLNTGLLTSLCALAAVISISAWPHTWIYIPFYYCIGQLYCNCLLAILNARSPLKSHQEEISLSYSGHGTQQKTNHGAVETSTRVPNNISIKVDTTKEYLQDEVGGGRESVLFARQYSLPDNDVKKSDVV